MVSQDSLRQVFHAEIIQQLALADSDKVRALVEGGVSVNSRDTSGEEQSLLHWAAVFGSAEVLRVLCELGADVNCSDRGE
jgi:ankyrin repeat protein